MVIVGKNHFKIITFAEMTAEEKYMMRCLQLAENGLGNVAPNPMVGAVIVHDGKIIGEGFHREYGGPHAEVNAIEDVLKNHSEDILADSSLFVNLEPCSHHGKTPPCCDLILLKKIKKIFIAMKDPFAQVNGEGIRKLTNAGLDVVTGICEKEAQELNRRFIHFHIQKRPYVILKYAQSLDGFISPKNPTPENRWITNSFSKKLVHKWRSEEPAIMVGTKTAILDNPELTVREWPGKDPLRIVIDRTLKLPEHLHLLNGKVKTLIINEKKNHIDGLREWHQLNFNEAVLPQLMTFMHDRNIQSVIVEGGLQLLQKFIDAGIWEEARILTGDKWLGSGIQAPKIEGEIFFQTTIVKDRLVVLRK